MRITSGKLKNQKIIAPKGLTTRPTLEIVRKSVFDSLGPSGAHGTFLDVFAGSGAMSFEAISRGFSHAYLIENSYDATNAIRKNIANLSLKEQVTLYRKEVISQLPKLKSMSFDVIFIDPPYEKNDEASGVRLSIAALTAIDQLGLLAPQGTLFLESSKKALSEDVEKDLESLRFIKKRLISDTFIYEFK